MLHRYTVDLRTPWFNKLTPSTFLKLYYRNRRLIIIITSVSWSLISAAFLKLLSDDLLLFCVLSIVARVLAWVAATRSNSVRCVCSFKLRALAKETHDKKIIKQNIKVYQERSYIHTLNKYTINCSSLLLASFIFCILPLFMDNKISAYIDIINYITWHITDVLCITLQLILR